ncbi:FecR family protein [Qipengyuania qiaonensis]|uniref:DUF4880 domain-containing protein n=1 Tax=Qipengyuania qiaonensis TaxID=2867240 RepID=A0ABS7JBA6_9SPHN|nr:DUF4880 domain-containing protein [Qipengyuania qiaonensis]MBX7483349.1 DUF4880 domain-containing protein [Qipengyuania qiaonensis]
MSQDAKAGDEIAEAAADWLVRLDTGSADPVAFEAWRSSDPRHASVFAQMAATWKRIGDLRWASTDDDAVGPSAMEAIEPELPRRGIDRRAAITGLAASIAAIATGAGFWMHMRRETATTAIGERRVVRLPGGALASLNTATEIAWRMGETLEIWIESGEAAFRLAGKGAVGAVLYAATMRAELAGGSYNVRLFEQGPRFAVMAGSAAVSAAGGFTDMLHANEVLTASASGFLTLPLASEELAQTGAWQRGEIIFDGMELSAALDEFNRYLAEPIRLGDPAIGAIRLGGRFRTDDPSGFLQSLYDGFGIASRRSDTAILLYQK